MMCARTASRKPQQTLSCFSCVKLTVIIFRYFQKKWVRQMLLVQNRAGYWLLENFPSEHFGNVFPDCFHRSITLCNSHLTRTFLCEFQ